MTEKISGLTGDINNKSIIVIYTFGITVDYVLNSNL